MYDMYFIVNVDQELWLYINITEHEKQVSIRKIELHQNPYN